jgi:hypothetical protein
MHKINKFTSSSSSSAAAAAATENAVQKISCGPVCLGLPFLWGLRIIFFHVSFFSGRSV